MVMNLNGCAELHEWLMSPGNVEDLVAIREATSKTEFKRGGVIDVEGSGAMDHPIIKQLIGNREIVHSVFVDTPFAFGIHADTGDGLHLSDQMMIITLDSDPDPAPTVFFHQHWFGASSNFVKGTPDFPSKTNKTVSDYADVKNLSSVEIPDDQKEKYLSHLKPQWLEGLSVQTVIPWCEGSVLVFPCTQLHASAAIINGRKRSLVLRVRPNRI